MRTFMTSGPMCRGREAMRDIAEGEDFALRGARGFAFG